MPNPYVHNGIKALLREKEEGKLTEEQLSDRLDTLGVTSEDLEAVELEEMDG